MMGVKTWSCNAPVVLLSKLFLQTMGGQTLAIVKNTAGQKSIVQANNLTLITKFAVNVITNNNAA